MDISNVSTMPSIEVLVSQYMSIERQPVVQLEDDKKEINMVKNIFTDLKSKLTALRSAADDLKKTGTDSQFAAKMATSANESVLTATAGGAATSGSHMIKVNQLAKADTRVSGQINRNDTSLASTIGAGTKSFTVTINGEETQIDLEINADDDNATIMSNLAQAINDSGAEVSASVVNDSSTTARLSLRSENTGSDYAISIADDSGTLINSLGLDTSAKATDTAGGYIYDPSELDAKFELDGISIVSDSNSVDDVLQGVTLNLTSVQEAGADPVQLTIETDSDTVKSNLETFFKAYNDVLDYIKLKTSVDPELEVRGELAGDFTFINLRMNLRTLVSSAVSSVTTGNPRLISEVGIEPNSSGNLSIADSEKFSDALDLDSNRVADLFTSENGIANQIYNILTPFTKTGGIIDDDKSALDSRIRNINSHISNLEARLAWKEENYRNQFTKLQEAYSAIATQQSMLQSLSSYY
ncbi:flagellar filament capping protein FliD [candidate division KSB1 bacterium]|nr:flagellar filament capping protein FliD [candidate division KSB1 bacterium]